MRIYSLGLTLIWSSTEHHRETVRAPHRNADNMKIPEARRKARRLIAKFIEPANKDGCFRTLSHPVTAFAEEFLDRQACRWKPRTQKPTAGMCARGPSTNYRIGYCRILD